MIHAVCSRSAGLIRLQPFLRAFPEKKKSSAANFTAKPFFAFPKKKPSKQTVFS